MYQVALLPIQEDETRTLMAKNEVWAEFREYLRRTRQGSLMAMIVIDPSQPVTRLTVPTEQAHALLRAAGLRY